MKLSVKMGLASAGALLLVFVTAMFGIYQLNQSLEAYEAQDQVINKNERDMGQLSLAFKRQVREWNNTLLRGKDPKQLDLYWQAFQQQEREVSARTQNLLATLAPGESKTLLSQFAQAHARMGQRYRQGFDAFTAANFDPRTGDVAVQDLDREPAKLIEAASQKIEADGITLAARATEEARKILFASTLLMLGACGVGILACILFSRAIARPLIRATEFAQAVSSGTLSIKGVAVGQDEIAQLLQALNTLQFGPLMPERQDAEDVATDPRQITLFMPTSGSNRSFSEA